MEQITLNISKEEYYLSKVESFCYDLRNAMIDLSLKFPEISTFERYMFKLESVDSIVYIMGLLHRCWCFANPRYLFDTLPKNIPDDKLINILLSKYQPDSERRGVGVLKEELDKQNNILIMAWYRAYQQNGKVQVAFSTYMEQIFSLAHKVCYRKDIHLQNGFVVSDTIETSLTVDKLVKAFNIFSKQFKCCADSEDNRLTFLSIFDLAVCASPRPIQWIDVGSSRGREPSLASIHTIFETLGVEMTTNARRIICNHIIWPKGKITPDQIKARKSPKQKELRKALLTAIK